MRKGFTLIETVIAIGLFSIIISIAIGGFVNALHIQKELAELIAAQSNASEAIEQMTREIRTGYLFCTTPNNSGGNVVPNDVCKGSASAVTTFATGPWKVEGVLDFFNANSDEVTYHLKNNALYKYDGTGADATDTPVTGDNVSVKYLNFYLQGNAEGDHWYPRITMMIGIAPSTTDPAISNDVIHLQTTVSARGIDCDTSVTPNQC
jgi:prepilin-type N-terminal cleavage/methylation domain-containing protein